MDSGDSAEFANVWKSCDTLEQQVSLTVWDSRRKEQLRVEARKNTADSIRQTMLHESCNETKQWQKYHSTLEMSALLNVRFHVTGKCNDVLLLHVSHTFLLGQV